MILSNADNCHRSVCAKNNGVRPLVITEAGDEELFTSVLSTLSQMRHACFPRETLKTVSGGILDCKTALIYINICQRDRREGLAVLQTSLHCNCDKLAGHCMSNPNDQPCYNAQ